MGHPQNPSQPIAPSNWPLAYFITFRTYGTWLHGDQRGAIDRKHNRLGDPIVEHVPSLLSHREASLQQAAMILTSEQRACAELAMRETCRLRDWTIHALNVRTNHVHTVVTGQVEPGRILGDLKRWATRGLREQRLVGTDRLVWAEDGSKQWLWDSKTVADACDYTMNGQ